ncbi:MAG TPA: FAD-dependent oxidoreductase [Caulobacteraceae bacterium]|nr:FAD-dependent oxidoreductase [Caulobacteraceae bacterium]
MKRRLRPDLAVIGAGSGGLSVAAGAAQLGLSVVLFEHGEMGGDCLNFGCVPSKALISAAAKGWDFARAMAHVRATIETIAPIDSQERFEGLGVTVIRETARFVDRRTVESDSVRVSPRRVVIAAGSRPKVPPIPALEGVDYLTNETIFDLQTLPERLAIIGGGPIGLELGQAFARLGSKVTVFEAERCLAREDADLAAVVLDQLRADGVDIREGAKVEGFEPGSTVLVATGRAPNVEGLNLEAAGVAYDAHGIRTDRSLRTSSRRVYAVGDITGRPAFTHVAGAHAALFIRRALFASPINAERLVIPRVTYTDPELAAVGLTEAEARARHGEAVKVVTHAFHDNDRAQTECDTRGFGKLITDRRGRILGAAIVGKDAGDLIAPFTLAMSAGVKLSALAGVIAPYPTRGEIVKRLAGQWYSPILFAPRTRRLVSLLKRLA